MSKILVVQFVALCGAIVLAGSSLAQEFSADVVTQMPGGAMSKGKMYTTPEKERLDMSIANPLTGGTMQSRSIIDRKQKLIYVVEPEQRMILVNHVLQQFGGHRTPSGSDPCQDLAQALGPSLPQMMQQCQEVGTETVNGRSTTKWRMQMKTMLSQPATGYVWIDPRLRTAIKWDFPGQAGSGELENIQAGPQAASLFELPAGYKRQDLPIPR